MGTLETLPTLIPGQVLGGCRIVRRIGRGGMGEVYLAEHVRLEMPVAVKVLPLDWATPDRVQRFLKEARIGARIEHANVVTVHDVGHEQGVFYIIMQYIDGVDLSQLLRQQGGPLPWRSAVKIIRLAAKGLHAVHRQRLVHRDIKPSNIMLAGDGRVLLMDFGLIRQESRSDITQAGHVVGTVPFMSPEQCLDQRLDRRSDVFSLGSTFYTLLTHQNPFTGTNPQIILQIGNGKTPRPVHEVNPEIPVEVSAVVATAMAHRPTKRYQDAMVLFRALTDLSRIHSVPQHQLDDTETFENASSQSLPELQLLDELPIEDIQDIEMYGDRKRWLIVLGAVIATLLIGLLVSLVAMGVANRSPSADTTGMVKIDAGYARLGNSEARIRMCLDEYLSDEHLQQLVGCVKQEPLSRTFVGEFWMDRYEVTNAEYARFVKATDRHWPEHWTGANPPPELKDHPVVNVRYEDAEAFAGWLGKKLPTREQWMRAFRGDNDTLFPWGDEYDAALANVADNPSHPSTSSVDATQRDLSCFDVCNLAGNASEYIRGMVTHTGSRCRVTKGAHYAALGYVYGVGSMSVYFTFDSLPNEGVGFRCVVEPP